MNWKFFSLELLKLFARRRTYIGFGVFFCLELLLLWMMRLPAVERSLETILQRSGFNPTDYLSGVTFALLILVWSSFLLGALYLSLVGGDLVAKETEDGTMRMILCRPVSRSNIIIVKAGVATVYTLSLVFFIGLTALAAGHLNANWGGLFVYLPTERIFAAHEASRGFLLYILSLPLMSVSMLTITLLAFFFSCFKIKPAAATILCLTVFFVDSILRNIPYFEKIQNFFITTKMNYWLRVFSNNPPWEAIIADMVFLCALNCTLVLCGVIVFEFRQVKS